jgi:DNA-directed RNA polymerase specialized sigma24 family protein
MAAVHPNNSAPPAAGDPTRSLEAATAVFAEHRRLLCSLVYNLSSTVSDTEDILHDTWLARVSSSRQEVGNARAYLLRIAVNQALSRRRRQRRSRETDLLPDRQLVEVPDSCTMLMRDQSAGFARAVRGFVRAAPAVAG